MVVRTYERKPLAERWRAQVSIPDDPQDCWLWTGARLPTGYGVIGQGGAGGRLLKAHRVALEVIACQAIPDGWVVMHTCDNPPCVNPAHLRSGTYSDNALDSVRKGRARNQNATKTHCPQGHAYDEANTYVHPDGRRACRTCRRDWDRTNR